MSLREVLADLDVRVRGLGAVRSANVELDRYVADLGPAKGALDGLKIKQAEMSETAALLAARIRTLQRAEGDNSAEIMQLRVAHLRATEAAAEAGAEAHRLANAETIAADAAKKAAREQELATKKLADEQKHAATAAEQLAKEQDDVAKEERAAIVQGFAFAVAGIAAAAAIASRAARFLAGQIEEVVSAGAELDDLSNRLNVSSGRLQEWGFIADQNGASLETITRGLENVTRSATANAAAYRHLGVATRDSGGNMRSQEDILDDSLRALAGVTNETERAAMARQIFGRSGNELLGVIRGGPEELDRLRARFQELGGGMSEASVAATAAADDSFGELRTAMVSLRDVLTPVVIPAITSLVTTVADGVGYLTRLGRETTFVRNMFRLGTTAAAGFVPQLRAAWVVARLLAAPIVGSALVIDDLATAMDGGHSAIGRWVEGLLAAEGRVTTFRGWVEGLRVELLELNADLLETSAMMGEFFTPGTDYAAGLRERADAATTSFRGARAELARGENERFTSRALGARAATIAAGGEKGERALADARAAAANNITRNVTNIINGGDPNEVRRILREENERALRSEADALGLAPAGAT